MKKHKKWVIALVLFILLFIAVLCVCISHSKNKRLIEAIENQDLTEVRTAIERGASVRALYPELSLFPVIIMPESPLQIAVEQPESQTSREIISLLLSEGADPNVSTRTRYLKETPLLTACRQKKTETARLLIAAGADINAWDEHGSVLSALLEHGNMWRDWNRPSFVLFRELIDAGASLDMPYGRTVLHAAAMAENTAAWDYLLEKTALDPLQKDEEGYAAMDYWESTQSQHINSET